MKGIRNFALMCLIIVCCNSLLSAQEQVMKGMIFTLEGDTMHGCIKTSGEQKSARNCMFRKEQQGNFTEYTPEQIQGYRYDNGKYYISKDIVLNGNRTRTFLEYIVNGKASIYYYNDKLEHYFIATGNGAPVELTEPDRIIVTDSGKYLAPKIYKGKLAVMLSDWKGGTTEINNTLLNHKSLIRLAEDYHKSTCTTSSCIVYERKVAKVKLHLGMEAGLQYSRYKWGTEIYSNFGPGYMAGMRLQLMNTTNSLQNFAYETGLYLQYSKGATIRQNPDILYESRVDYNGSVYYLNNDTNLMVSPLYNRVTELNVRWNLYTIRIPVGIYYSFSYRKIQPAIGAGVSYTNVISQNKSFDYNSYTQIYSHSFPMKYLGVYGKAGLRLKLPQQQSAQISVAYEYSFNPTINKTRVHPEIIGINIGYMF